MAQVIGWLLDGSERARLLERFPPAYPDVVAHHVTFERDPSGSKPLPSAKQAEIIGEADDGAGVQALVVQIDGATARPDGSTWHVTWSLDRARGRQAVDSNEVIARCGWRPCVPAPLTLIPAKF